jgi:ubiquinone/menaquinone biosynthesis C-methylase UbiE
MKNDLAQQIISKTRDDYNLIADQFAGTRKYNWPEVTQTLNEILSHFEHKQKIKVLDIGCGAGRVYDFFKGYQVDYTGVDISKELIGIAKKSYPREKFIVADATELPFQDNSFDLVFSIATIHHIPSKELRQKFIDEAYRVTKPGGLVFIDTWYFWNKPAFLIKIIKSFLSFSGLPFGDFLRPWKDSKGKVKAERYFHAWTIHELKSGMKKSGLKELKVFDYYIKNRNLHIVGKK